MKPYQNIAIQECGEPLAPIPLERFSVVQPHPYACLGAPYGDRSPYWLRASVLAKLRQAQTHLQQRYPGWTIQIFDAYRPVAVQQFMVDYSFRELARQRQQHPERLTAAERQALLDEVYQFWAPPSLDEATPPPHSTGAAIDITLGDDQGQMVDMGSPIDEISPRSHPNYFAATGEHHDAMIQNHRTVLSNHLTAVGFAQHPNEWWHFSWGDQLWAWQTQNHTGQTLTARYGRALP
ncbi:MAG: M15 family metallopeptidase [Cyanobacteria bacterium]|nr:M15 family metallopeptidase [Cyanobacteriota bacterium]MDA0865729.1 M15 family metallopeptidase [Cyanobacteriota bacterium]